ncbi:MAG: hypothetical protein RLZZ161_909, partial [Bacteroidota bacterium]
PEFFFAEIHLQIEAQVLEFHLFIIGKTMVFNGHFCWFWGIACQQASRSKKHQVFHNANVGKEWGNKKCLPIDRSLTLWLQGSTMTNRYKMVGEDTNHTPT